jgi:plasmid stabilization system protein ParE
LRIHPEAAREARAARRWYSDRNPDAGARFLQEYSEAITAIAEGPARWPAFLGARRYHLHRFPYSVIYEVAIDGVAEILAVAHDSRRPGYWRLRGPR